ncbi:HlyD family efflux transporter periplasmic adaptor subunit [Shewanella olleyana]|uniref:HlyD family secretion protein n=1 Tax=Shewanella olleyana TaxID=135626 RepID=UPI002010A571|nr:HlyD family efflux transporter periplasmic adaptor subunit [Shewanella olleyana]MCL1068296.1 HlyD family efflux transporter periplasmic adaptor subunit [Shewanella olleyana]
MLKSFSMISKKALTFSTLLVYAYSNVVLAQHVEIGSGKTSATEFTSLLLTGQVASKNLQPFVVPKAGRAWRYQIQWMLPEGSVAKAGEVVVVFDKSEIANQIEQLEASLLRVTAQEQNQTIELDSQLLQAEFDLKKARLEQEKAQLDGAIPIDFIAAKDYADNQFELLRTGSELSKKNQALIEIIDKRKATLAQLAIDKQRSQLELEQALQGLEQLELKADIDGPILYGRDNQTDKKFAVGDSVQIGRQIATVPAMNNLEVIAWVNEVDVDRLLLSSPVTIRLDSQPDISLKGNIADISLQASKQPAWGSSNWFRVSISFDSDERVKIIPGMSVLVGTGGAL